MNFVQIQYRDTLATLDLVYALNMLCKTEKEMVVVVEDMTKKKKSRTKNKQASKQQPNQSPNKKQTNIKKTKEKIAWIFLRLTNLAKEIILFPNSYSCLDLIQPWMLEFLMKRDSCISYIHFKHRHLWNLKHIYLKLLFLFIIRFPHYRRK